ncbi:hypothetical protein, partial [Streptomyces sp. NRRL B-24085]|uniref:hypothetical protein n=1 Tax=Streptomyces sp. NRRL B-24085 TaxID=1709476 RepID=UPI000B1AE2B1
HRAGLTAGGHRLVGRPLRGHGLVQHRAERPQLVRPRATVRLGARARPELWLCAWPLLTCVCPVPANPPTGARRTGFRPPRPSSVRLARGPVFPRVLPAKA